jgi:D-aminopeptidase
MISMRRPLAIFFLCAGTLVGLMPWSALAGETGDRLGGKEMTAKPRARDYGIQPGILVPGPLNAITDVAGVLVGHVTLKQGTDINTGVTAVLPHGGNIYQDKVPAGFAVANGFGKFTGSTQVRELGEIETPIILTNTLSVAEGMKGAIEYTLSRPGNEEVRSVNAIVGETNDGYLNDIRRRVVTADHVLEAIGEAKPGPVPEGPVGAGTGTISFGWKGGIGTSSRRLPDSLGAYTVGVLAQTNYGGILQMDGVAVGEALNQYYLRDVIDKGDADGSVILAVATDAPLSDRNLERLAARALMAVARTGSPVTNGSGDYAIAFSTADSVRRSAGRRAEASQIQDLPNQLMSPLFQAVIEASEESIYNALVAGETVMGFRGEIKALPLGKLEDLVRRHGKKTQ